MSNGEEIEKAKQRSFTGDKLDWMNAVSADPLLDARAFEVAFCIAQHVNKASGLAILSDDTIADKTGIARRWVARARVALREGRWIDWKRTKTANIYWTKGDRIGAVTDHQVILKERRDERKTKLKKARQVMPPVANIHLSDYTVEDIYTVKSSLPSGGADDRGGQLLQRKADRGGAVGI